MSCPYSPLFLDGDSFFIVCLFASFVFILSLFAFYPVTPLAPCLGIFLQPMHSVTLMCLPPPFRHFHMPRPGRVTEYEKKHNGYLRHAL